MSLRLGSFRDANRGASETAGAALLIGLVAFAALATLVLGGGAIDGVQSQTDERQASTILQEMDSRFSSLSSGSGSPSMSFDLGETNPDNFLVRQDGSVNVTVNRDLNCSSNVSMSSLRFDNDQGSSVGYEGGGVWRLGEAGGSSMITSPSIAFNDGTIDIHVVNLTGTFDQAKNRAEFLEAKSQADSLRYSNRLFQGDCGRPDNVTMKVRSDYYVAWGDYLETEFPGTVKTFDSNRTARVFLPQGDLPERVDNSRNNVVNLTASYSDPTISNDTGEITINKSANNVYSVSVTPLTTDEPSIGNITNIDDATNITRPPLDVMFVTDESASMAQDDGDGDSRAEEAQDAAQGFLAELNGSMDRAGLVSFANGAEYRITEQDDGRYITSDFDELNDTIETVGASGGTESQYGMEYANDVFQLRSNSTRDRVMVLLTDGVNDDCQKDNPDGSGTVPINETDNDDPLDCAGPNSDNAESLERAEEAAANGVTIYTIGYGDDADIDEGFLETVADRTGGNYYQATSSDQLDAVFDDIVEEIAQTKNIALSPVSASYTGSGGRAYSPQAAGSTDHVARFNVSGNEFANINDPTAASRFSYSFAVTDGETVEISAYDYGCDQWAGTGRTRTHNGDIFNIVRCTNITNAGTLEPNKTYTDGNNISHLLNVNEAWWQENITEIFNRHSINVNRNASSPNYGKLDLESNQALVWWDLPDGADSENHLLMLYEIGISESEADVSGVINLEVSTIDLSD